MENLRYPNGLLQVLCHERFPIWHQRAYTVKQQTGAAIAGFYGMVPERWYAESLSIIAWLTFHQSSCYVSFRKGSILA